jgi:mannose-6-phosphate isomerase
MMTEDRPWGSYTILEERGSYKVKRIEIFPGKRLSYQRHEKRSEHWVVVEGEAVVTLEGKEIRLSPGQSVDIPRMAAHRVLNSGNGRLTMIEVQRGAYLGEDDIIRLEDDFGRSPT